MRRCCIYIFFFVPAFVFAQEHPDAITILRQASANYASAKSLRIEATTERTSHNGFERSWNKSILLAVEAPGGRYRYEGRGSQGSAWVVSDGRTVSTLHVESHTYVQEDNQAALKLTHFGDESAALEARYLRKSLAEVANAVQSAVLLPDESVEINGHEIPCYVVRYTESDLKRVQSSKSVTTWWIDQARMVFLKFYETRETYLLVPPAMQRVPIFQETLTVFTGVELNQKQPENLFYFSPPAGTIQVDHFPTRMGEIADAAVIGKPVPDLQLSSGSKKVPVSSFRGHPVLLELWATWCSPCVERLPDLKRLKADAANTDLVLITVDENEEATEAIDFLRRHSVTWSNYHDQRGEILKALSAGGLPYVVLIDEKGNVAYAAMGYSIEDLRSAIAKLGPKYLSLAGATK